LGPCTRIHATLTPSSYPSALLTALVKQLRKCVRELGSRASSYVDQCLKVEKDFLKQVEGIQLQSESTLRSLEADLACAKKDLAQYEATFKTDKAKWGADLEDQKYEVGEGARCVWR
jgi:hypothetical protein